MAFIAEPGPSCCPYRDSLGIQPRRNRITWYELLAVPPDVEPDQLLYRWNQRRALAVQKRNDSGDPAWDLVLDRLDRALACLSHPRKRQEYDRFLANQCTRTEPPALRMPEQARRPTDRPRPTHVRDAKRPASVSDSTTAPPVSGNASPAEPSTRSPRSRFEPLRVIGRGPRRTTVFEAYEFTLARTVAVKCLDKPARTTERREAFLREARFLASLSHPGLVEIHQIHDRNCYMVMEYLPESLVSGLGAARNGSCPTDSVVKFLSQALDVLQAIHHRGMVHGAITPRSFLCARNGTAKLTDAPGCSGDGLFRVPAADQICVAPELLAPEVFGEPGPAVDLYMLGFTAVSLLAGDRLSRWFPRLDAPDDQSLSPWLRWHASPFEKLPDLSEHLPDLPYALVRVLERLCEKQVVERYHSAGAALGELTPLLRRHEAGSMSDGQPLGEDSPVDRSVSEIGGAPPLLVRAEAVETPSTDVFEMLQDPALLWQAVRRNRKSQVAVAMGATILLLLICLLPGSSSAGPQPESVVRRSDEAQAAEAEQPMIEPPADPRPAPPRDDLVEQTPRPPSRTSVVDTDLREIAPRVTAATVRPAVLPAAPSPAPRETSPPSLPKRWFPVRGGDAGLTRELRDVLARLSDARSSAERESLLQTAQQLAPDDPRPPFVFAATYGFSLSVREHLELAEKLAEHSHPQFTQPVRVQIESLLRDADDPLAACDSVCAELVRLRNQLDQTDSAGTAASGYRWIGMVLGYLDRRAESAPAQQNLVSRCRSLLCDGLNSECRSALDDGQQWFSRQYPQSDVAAADVFPPHSRLEIELCLQTLQPEADPHSRFAARSPQ